MIVKSLYVLADSIFVGVGVGAEGLGAVSLSVPFFSLSAAIALTIGIGGASIMSVELGKNNKDQAQKVFSQSMAMIFVTALVLVSLAFVFLEDLIGLMGASGQLAILTKDYLSVMLPFFIFHGMWWVLSAFVRNDTNPSLVMYATIGSALLNVVLDYVFIFVFAWGVKGAAFATGLSQAFTFTVLLSHFKSHKGILKLSFKDLRFDKARKIVKIGLPTFFVESTTAVSVMIFNYVLLRNYSPLHVSAYGIVMNVGLVGLFLLVGIGQACQPIISFNFGADRLERIKETLYLGLKYSLSIGLTVSLITIAFSRPLASLFTRENQALIDLASSAMKVYFLAPPIMAFNVIVATLFQSIEKPKYATIIALSRGFVFVVIGLLALPIVFPVNGIWASILFAELITAVYSGSKLFKYLKSSKKFYNHLEKIAS
ncbi:MATE family efflux transporter [Acidaminobacter sp. JC074]|nr:MATE family efflux transporter [Acidaminobacter sp. JC074]